jgi:peptidoglycan/xylan/chitin deacetylase (PgdA/CDA1 family)
MREFRRQMDLLRSYYEVVSLDEAIARAADQRAGRRGRPLAVVTFDDGHCGLHRYLLPYVEQEHLPVTVFVATGHVESGCSYWFDRAMNALQTQHPWTIDLRELGLGIYRVGLQRGQPNWEVIGALLDTMKRLPPDQREVVCDELVHQTQGAQSPRFSPLMPLSMTQLQDLGRSPWVTIGAHTHGHELLDQLPPDAAWQTMAHSRQLLQSWTGLPIRHFAYPNGNYNADLASQARDLGFASAFTTRIGLWVGDNDLYQLPRIPVGRYDDLSRFKWALLGGRVIH